MRLENLYEGTVLGGALAERCRVVVIGSGAGGAAVALALAARGIDVVMLEEGGWYPPASYRDLRPLDAFRTLYRDYGMTAALGRDPLRDPAIPFPLGKCVGGTTVVNSGTCFRTPPSILAQWRDSFGLPWDEASLAPVFADVEEILGAAPVAAEVLGGNAGMFARGAAALGWEGRPLMRNAPDCRGAGRCVFGCPSDAKQGTHLSYVPRALAAGARLYSDVRIDRIELDGARAVAVHGVLLDRASNRPRASARVGADAVVLAAGAVGTPLLMQRNGVARRNPHLGRNLRLHPGIRVCAGFDEPVEGWKGVPQGYYIDRFWREQGIMFEGIFVPPGVALPILPGVGTPFADICAGYPRLAAFGAMVKDSGGGEVRALGRRRQLIRYGLARVDVERLVYAVQRASEAFFAAGARVVYPAIHGHATLRDMDDVRRLDARGIGGQHLEMMAFHPMGTARMSARPQDGVVDGQGRVHGTDNLYVADASLFPTCLGVNPMVSIMAFATVIGHRLAERLGA